MQLLLFSSDPKLIATMRLACPKAGVSLTLCSKADEGAALLARNKMYAVAVDDDDSAAATQLLNAVRGSSSSKNAISIVFSSGKFMTGVPAATFVVTKPLSAELALRTLRAARSHMANELRRYFRYPLESSVAVTTKSNQNLEATCINISQRGLAVQFAAPKLMPAEGRVRARFALPSGAASIEMQGDVAWSDRNGRAGLRCHGTSPDDQKQLDKWLSTRIMTQA